MTPSSSQSKLIVGYLKSVDFTGDYIEASLLDPLAITFEKFLDELRNVAVNGAPTF